MSHPAPAFARLVAPVDVQQFFATYWEQQTLYLAEEIQGLPSSFGGDIGNVAMQLSNMLAPRVGAIYDPTQEGRSRVYGHWGRFYESVPMGVNWVSFGGTSYSRTTLPADACDPADPVNSCDETNAMTSQVFGGAEGLVSPGMRAQYVDEWIAGEASARGLSIPTAWPFARSTIQRSTRMFSPNPGQRNSPCSPRRNQLTPKMRGGSGISRPNWSQWFQ